MRAVSVRDRSPSSPRTSDEPSWFGRRDGAHRTRETRGEEFRLGGEIRDVRDVSVKLTPGEMVLEDLRGRGRGMGPGGSWVAVSEGRVNNDEIASWNGKGRCARLHAVRVTLHLHDDLVTRILQAEVQSSDAGEERDRLHRAGEERDRG